MNILRAEDYLRHYGPGSAKIAETYDDDEMLRMALSTLFPGFEYPDFSHLTVEQARKRYAANPRQLTS